MFFIRFLVTDGDTVITVTPENVAAIPEEYLKAQKMLSGSKL